MPPTALPSPVRSQRSLEHFALPPARTAGLLLLIAWLGPVTFVQTDGPVWASRLGPRSADGAIRTIPAGQALQLERGTPLELHLHDGTRIKGRYLGRTLLDESTYAKRYAAAFGSADAAPLALGETLTVALADGRTWSLPFAGFGELAFLLDAPDLESPLRVPFEYARELHRANGDGVDLPSLTRAFRKGDLPSAEALVVETLLPLGDDAQRWAEATHVPVEDIRRAMVVLPSGESAAGAVALGVVVAVVLFIVIIAVAANQQSKSYGCMGTSAVPPTFWSALTTRPFDTERRCYEGDVLVADAWPAEEDAPAMALAGP